MSKQTFIWSLTALLFPLFSVAQNETAVDSTGLPGDNFSLEGAVEMYKKSESPEDFEKRLNEEGNHVNNLDLNEDGETDYVRVVCHQDGEVHVLVLQVPVSPSESQDIATIEIEKQEKDYAILQIVGDEDVFGEQVISEPFEEENATKNKGRGGPSPQMAPVRLVVNVWFWPSVRFMYAPAYRVWVSPWHWAYYPSYWRPWRPHPYHRFRGWKRPYYTHCHVVGTHRVVRAHAVYAPRRTHSTVVHTRTTTVVNTRRNHGTVVKQRTSTTTVKERNGKHGKRADKKVERNNAPRGRAKERGGKAGQARKRGRN